MNYTFSQMVVNLLKLRLAVVMVQKKNLKKWSVDHFKIITNLFRRTRTELLRNNGLIIQLKIIIIIIS